MEDNAIIDLFCARSESAIAAASQKYGAYCTKIAMNILRSSEDADECVNDAYLAAWNAIPPHRPSIFSAFLGKITRNLAFDKYKSRNAKKRGGNEIELILDELEDCIASQNDVEAEFDAKQTSKIINEFLYSIESEQRAVFVRRYWYSDGIADIASRFNMSQSKVKSMLFRIRNKLKVYLETEGVLS